MKALKILDPGPLACIQDQGRFGYRDRGVPQSGAMDRKAYRIGNLLVGNSDGMASIEITWGGFKAEFSHKTWFAVTGAEVEVRLNGEAVPLWMPLLAERGDIIAFDYALSGVRAYLSISGGVDVPEIMGSRSTYLMGGFGGFEGRALRGGDLLPLGNTRGLPFHELPSHIVPRYCDHLLLRIVLGPQDDEITEEGIDTFLSSTYTITERCDRMGCVLSGPSITHREGADIISDGTVPGSIQVPGSGQPTILGVDCQTTGGYVKIATVISVDLSLLAQVRPGSRVSFGSIDLLKAREIYLKEEFMLRRLCRSMGKDHLS